MSKSGPNPDVFETIMGDYPSRSYTKSLGLLCCPSSTDTETCVVLVMPSGGTLPCLPTMLSSESILDRLNPDLTAVVFRLDLENISIFPWGSPVAPVRFVPLFRT